MRRKALILIVFLSAVLRAGTACASGTTYVLDARESVLSVEAASTGHRFSGWTSSMRGSLQFDRETETLAEKASVTFPLHDLTTGIPARDHAMQHMFEMPKFPDVVFQADHVTLLKKDASGGVETYRVDGGVSMHGVTKDISFEAKADYKEDRVEVSVAVPLELTWFGMKPPSVLGVFKVQPGVTVKSKTVWRLES